MFITYSLIAAFFFLCIAVAVRIKLNAANNEIQRTKPHVATVDDDDDPLGFHVYGGDHCTSHSFMND